MSVLERAIELLKSPKAAVINSPQELVEVYRLQGEQICSACPGVLSAKYEELRTIVSSGNFNSIFMNQGNSRKYKLPEGQSYRPFGMGEVYTNANLTDEIVEALIAENPAVKKVFIALGEESTDVNETPVTPDTPEEKVAQPLEQGDLQLTLTGQQPNKKKNK